ncbi:MAG: hypothetical protein HY820_19220 [Acidobacteria bacterium]|nr:hypothetical protein [Acidobacteriota bacterium]
MPIYPRELNLNLRSLLADKLQHFGYSGAPQPYPMQFILQQDHFLFFSSYPGCETCGPVFEQLRKLQLSMTVMGKRPFLIVNVPFTFGFAMTSQKEQDFFQYYAEKQVSWPWVAGAHAPVVRSAIDIGNCAPHVGLLACPTRELTVALVGNKQVHGPIKDKVEQLLWSGTSWKGGALKMAM